MYQVIYVSKKGSWNIYFTVLPIHDEMISFPWRHVLVEREAVDLYQRLMTNMGQWLCVWGVVMNEEKRVHGHKDWHTYPSALPMTAPTKLFFTTQWPVFSCASHELCKWRWHPFFLCQDEKIEVRELCPTHFFLFLNYAASEQPFMLAEWAWVAATWKDDGGHWVGEGGGSGHNDIYEDPRRQAGEECRPCC